MRRTFSRASPKGSSPLTRGKRHNKQEWFSRDGLIPAHAGKTTCPPESSADTWAHPRSRGENSMAALIASSFAGSSPLTRGKHSRARLSSLVAGLIPAHAGKTMRLSQQGLITRAHPRSRGENIGDASAWRPQVGSSPLTRGKHQAVPAPGLAGGLIPAHAGKTSAYPRLPAASRAHPRSRGENHPLLQEQDGVGGSSPLTRGKRGRSSRRRGIRRLIPAHAGKTVAPRVIGVRRRAHPRSRGENLPLWVLPSSGEGSSPLTRGKHSDAQMRVDLEGLIPAHAGKTVVWGDSCPRMRAHPRSRGENVAKGVARALGEGSSPLTRGKQHRSRLYLEKHRLIPAHAGKTPRRRLFTIRHPAHPRSRGENLARAFESWACLGSSPLTRGKPIRSVPSVVVSGLIPAHAGKTMRPRPIQSGRGAHPRSRGENRHIERPHDARTGSSPLTRGKRKSRYVCDRSPGLIPAHAGKTRGRMPASPGLRAHPRSRGENGWDAATNLAAAGSSPLTRGKQDLARQPPQGRGLIPAHAGKTSISRVGSWVSRAHPRSRGENRIWRDNRLKVAGSSPLTRGKQVFRGSEAGCRGLIPAHAGKTMGRSITIARAGAHPRSRGENEG